MEILVHFLALLSTEAPVKLNISTLTKALSREAFSSISKILFQNIPAYNKFSYKLAKLFDIPIMPLLSNSISLEYLSQEFQGNEIMIIMHNELVCPIIDIKISDVHELIKIRYFEGKIDIQESSSFPDKSALEDFCQIKELENPTLPYFDSSHLQAKKYEFNERGVTSLFINSAFEANVQDAKDKFKCQNWAKDIKRTNKKLERQVDKIRNIFAHTMLFDDLKLNINEIKQKIKDLTDDLSVVKRETYFRKIPEFIDKPLIRFPKDLSQISVNLSFEISPDNTCLKFKIENCSDFLLENLLLKEKNSDSLLKEINRWT